MKYPSRRCTAHKTDGDTCGNYSIKGGFVCAAHGGSAGHVREAANLRILGAVDPVISKLIALALDDDVPPAVQLRACIDVLDRAGLQPAQKVEITEITDEMLDAEIERLLTDMAEIRALEMQRDSN
jgi:hypothetical protein